MKKKSKNLIKSKPSYYLYKKLWYTLDVYLTTRIDKYIFFQYYEWNVPKLHIIKESSIKNLTILREIFEYDYKVFKTLLFLYWDLENYLESTDYVKYSLENNIEDLDFLSIKFKDQAINDEVFLDKIYLKKLNYLWTSIELRGKLEQIFKYDIYSKINSLDTTYKNENYISIYKVYKKYNDKISEDELVGLMGLQSLDSKIPPLYYESYIEKWYKEWSEECLLHKNASKKYRMKIEHLDTGLNKLLDTFIKQWLKINYLIIYSKAIKKDITQ